MVGRQSDSRRRRLSGLDRRWIASLTFAGVVVVVAAALIGVAVPRLIGQQPSPLAAAVLVGWIVVLALTVRHLARPAADGDEIAQRALANRRDRSDDYDYWNWPNR